MKNRIEPKGLKQILEEDKSLQEKVTYEEFSSGKIIPTNSDVGIKDAYEVYRKIKLGNDGRK